MNDFELLRGGNARFESKNAKRVNITREEVNLATEIFLMCGGNIDRITNVPSRVSSETYDFDNADNFLMPHDESKISSFISP